MYSSVVCSRQNFEFKIVKKDTNSSKLKQVSVQRPHGCLILDVVYRATLSGVARVREALQHVLYECHKVFYKQLLAWILKGNLHDPFGEFIIEPVLDSDQPIDTISIASSYISSSSITTSSSTEGFAATSGSTAQGNQETASRLSRLKQE